MYLFDYFGYKFTTGDVAVGIDDNLNGILPHVYSLEQNYPNPFNPSTIIEYALPQKSFVSLIVYDLRGKKVAELINEEKSAGHYTFNFYAGKLPSGIYFYTINSNNFTQTKKMLLLK